MTSTRTGGVVTVNGVERPHDEGTSVTALVTELLGGAPEASSGAGGGPASGDAPTGVAVAVDDAIVPRGLWATTLVPAGARVEVVTAVQGG